MCTHECRYLWRPEEDLLKLELQVVVCCLTQTLGTELQVLCKSSALSSPTESSEPQLPPPGKSLKVPAAFLPTSLGAPASSGTVSPDDGFGLGWHRRISRPAVQASSSCSFTLRPLLLCTAS